MYAIRKPAILLCLILSIGCKGRREEPAPPPSPLLEITDGRLANGLLTVAADACVEYVEVKTNIKDWTAQSGGTDVGWLTVEPVRDPPVPLTGAAVTQRLRVTVGANTIPSSRRGSVTLSGGDIQRGFTVEQAPAGAILTFDTPRSAAAAGEELEVAVEANVEYDVTIPSQFDWVEEVTAADAAQGTHSFRVAANTDAGPRSAGVEFRATSVPGLRKTLVINQLGSGPALFLDGPERIEIPWDGEELTVGVRSNVPYGVSATFANGEEPWLWHFAARGFTERDERFTTDVNMGSEERTATIQFTTSGHEGAPVTRSVTVVQGAYFGVVDEYKLASPVDGLFAFGCDRKEFKVSIRTTRDAGTIAIGELGTWITSAAAPTRSDNYLIFTFVAHENLSTLRRSHTLRFTSGDDILSVEVRQDGNIFVLPTTGYSSVAGLADGADYRTLADGDASTYALAAPGPWPQTWRFTLDDDRSNILNRIVYYPVMAIEEHRARNHSTDDHRVREYSIEAYHSTTNTHYTVAEGTVPLLFYSDTETMSKGYEINIPTIARTRYLFFSVKSVYGSGTVFGASGIEILNDTSQDIYSKEQITIDTDSPLVVTSGARGMEVKVSANVPYEIDIEGSPEWITWDRSYMGSEAVRFTLQENSGAERSAVITLRPWRSAAKPQSITLTQRGPVVLRLKEPASGTLSVGYEGCQGTAVLTTNLPPDNISCGTLPDWITLEGNTALSDTDVKYSFKISANSAGPRDRVIWFSCDGQAVELRVEQAGAPEPEPYITLKSPDPPELSFDASPATDGFKVVLTTNAVLADITVDGLPEWLARGEATLDAGEAVYPFTVAANSGDARKATLSFSLAGGRGVSVTVSQSGASLPGVPVTPTRTIYYDMLFNQHPLTDITDGNPDTFHTISTTDIWAYEFNFPTSTDLISLIYYPRNSAEEHGTIQKVSVVVVVHEGSPELVPFTVTIPESVFATEAGRRAGWRIDLPYPAENVALVRLIPESGYQSVYGVAEVGFYAPE